MVLCDSVYKEDLSKWKLLLFRLPPGRGRYSGTAVTLCSLVFCTPAACSTRASKSELLHSWGVASRLMGLPTSGSGQMATLYYSVNASQAPAQQSLIVRAARQLCNSTGRGQIRESEWLRPVDAVFGSLRVALPLKLRQSFLQRQCAPPSRAMTSGSLGWIEGGDENTAGTESHSRDKNGSLDSWPGKDDHTATGGYSGRKEFFLLSYDYVDGIMEKRTPYREAHLALTCLWQSKGLLLLGGAFKDPVNGAAIVLLASDIKEIERDFVKCDPYILNGLVTSYTIRPWTVVVGSALSPELNPQQLTQSNGSNSQVASTKAQVNGHSVHSPHQSSPVGRLPGMPPSFEISGSFAKGSYGKTGSGRGERCVALERSWSQPATNGVGQQPQNGAVSPAGNGVESSRKNGAMSSASSDALSHAQNGPVPSSSNAAISQGKSSPQSSANGVASSRNSAVSQATNGQFSQTTNAAISQPEQRSEASNAGISLEQATYTGNGGTGSRRGEPKRAIRLSGMTGFARTEGNEGRLSWTWEARSVNGRSLDVRTRVPDAYMTLQQVATSASAERFARGTISIFLNIQVEKTQKEGQVSINAQALEQVTKELAALQKNSETLGALPTSNLDSLLRLPGMVQWVEAGESEEEKEAQIKAVTQGLMAVLDQLAVSRRGEGSQLAAVLRAQLDEIAHLTEEAASLAAMRPETLKERVKQQVKELLQMEDRLDPARLEQEVAILAIRMDVREELERLKLHVASAKELLSSKEPSTKGSVRYKAAPIGRSLDFLAQEFFREANTLCSKANDVSLTQVGLKIKGVIEQFREQAANVE